MADEAAGVVGADVERGRDGAALNEVGAVGKAHESRHVAPVGGYGACHGEVTDGGTVDVAEEGRAAIVGVGNRGRNSLVVAEEGAAKWLVVAVIDACTCHRRHADVLGQLHVLVDEAHASVDVTGKVVPVVRAADEIGVSLSARTLRRPFCLHDDGRAAPGGRARSAATAAGSAVVYAVVPA